MGKYKAYPAYKCSGVEWIGQVPSHWNIHSLKRTVEGCANGIWGSEPDGESDLIVLRVADFDRVKLNIRDDKLTYRSIPDKDTKSRLLKSGDLLIEKSGGGDKTLVGCVVRFDKDYPAVTSNFVAKMRPLTGYDSAFLNYAFAHLYSGRVNYPAIKQTTGIQNLDSDAYLMERFAFPSLEEQRTIAAFLNYETARIDGLIDKQQRLIELLKEKRQAVISHAVTKSLNPAAPMKDSGVEWLGQVPEHWKCSRVGWLCEVGNGMTPNRNNIDYWSEGHIPWLNSSKVNDGEVYFAEQFVTETAFAECSLPWVKSNSVIMAITGEGKTRGTTAITRIDTTINQHVAYMMPTSERIVPDFLCMWLQSQYGRIRFESAGWGSTKAAITCSDIKAYPVPLPPVLEQVGVVEFVKASNTKFDNLMAKATKQVDLLQERRTALISAAVTGKIDLRDWVKPA